MKRLTLILTGAAMLAAPGLWAEALGRPEWVKVKEGPKPEFTWSAVKGAGLYRVAVFAQPDDEGKRPLMGAIWAKGLSYAYGAKAAVAKAGKLPSTSLKPLDPGRSYKVWVSAARADGSDKGDWTVAEFTAREAGDEEEVLDKPAAAPTPKAASTPAPATPSFTPTPVPEGEAEAKPTAAETAAAAESARAKVSGEAEVVVDLSSEFKETPEAAEVTATPEPQTLQQNFKDISLPEAKALLAEKKYDLAEQAFRSLLARDDQSADAWEGLGDSFDGRSMKVEAAEAYKKAWKLDDSRLRLKEWLDKNVRH